MHFPPGQHPNMPPRDPGYYNNMMAGGYKGQMPPPPLQMGVGGMGQMPPPNHQHDHYDQGHDAYYGGQQMGGGGYPQGGGQISPQHQYGRVPHMSVAHMYDNPEHDNKKAYRQQQYKEDLERQIREKKVAYLSK
eukprot:9477592-Pyramimonas_sp.AAC.3